MSKMYISNTLVNDTLEGLLSYAEQSKDKTVNWSNYHYTDEEGHTVYPFQSKTDLDKFQNKLNELFLSHYNDFQEFLHSKGVNGVIDTWLDVEEFLEGMSDTDIQKLLDKLNFLQTQINTLDAQPGGFNLSAYRQDGQGNYATYDSLYEAITDFPNDMRRGGIIVVFILRTNIGTLETPVYTYKYVQYRLTNTDWSTNLADWDTMSPLCATNDELNEVLSEIIV